MKVWLTSSRPMNKGRTELSPISVYVCMVEVGGRKNVLFWLRFVNVKNHCNGYCALTARRRKRFRKKIKVHQHDLLSFCQGEIRSLPPQTGSQRITEEPSQFRKKYIKSLVELLPRRGWYWRLYGLILRLWPNFPLSANLVIFTDKVTILRPL